jgi:heme A synthase
LGAATVLSLRAVIPTTSHVAIGAAVLATSLLLALLAARRERPAFSAEILSAAADAPVFAARREVRA